VPWHGKAWQIRLYTCIHVRVSTECKQFGSTSISNMQCAAVMIDNASCSTSCPTGAQLA
jgi:hypothetical protein